MLVPRKQIEEKFFPLIAMTSGGKTRISVILCSAAPTRYIPRQWIPRYCVVDVAYGCIDVGAVNYKGISIPSRKKAIEAAVQAAKESFVFSKLFEDSRITHICKYPPCRKKEDTANRALQKLLDDRPGLDVIGGLMC